MSENSTNDKQVGVGIIGLGGMGAGHGRRLVAGEIPGAYLAAVSDLNKEQCEKFPDVAQFQDVAEMLAHDAVDAVIIATPHFSHVPLSIQSLQAGKHVLVEKPLAVSKADCEKAIAVADEHPDLVFAEMFNQRTDPLYIKLKSLIDNNELGEIRRINWIITDWFRTEAYYASGSWRATWYGEGGGVLVNQCPHNIDLLQWLCGMPSRVHAFCNFGKFHDIEVEDEVTAYLEFPNGATGVFVTSTGEAPGTNRLEIAGEMGKVVVEAGSLTWTRNEVGMTQFSKETEQSFGGPATWDISIPTGSESAQHLVVMKKFIDKIRGQGELVADGREGIRQVELANAMLASSQLQKPIDLPMDASVHQEVLDALITASPKTPKQHMKQAQ